MTSIEDKLREARLRWFGHINRRSMDASVRKCKKIYFHNLEEIEVDRRSIGAN